MRKHIKGEGVFLLICLIPDVRVTIIVTIILHITLLVGMVADWFRERIKISAAIVKAMAMVVCIWSDVFPKGSSMSNVAFERETI